MKDLFAGADFLPIIIVKKTIPIILRVASSMLTFFISFSIAALAVSR